MGDTGVMPASGAAPAGPDPSAAPAARGRGRPGGPDRAPATPATPAIALDGVTKRFGRELVLRELRLEMAAGRVAVLKGSNGAGKTTLLRLLATRLRPTRGRARIFGYDLQRDGDEVRRRVGLLSVLGGNYAMLTARENLRLATTLSGLPRADIDAALARVGLAAVADGLVRTFSSGMKKRLGLARLLLVDPPLWLLDEPFAALDEDGRLLLEDALSAARAQGRTVLMASHELERSARFADAVLDITGGRLVHAGRPA